MLRLGVDIGGTFTDFVIIDVDSGETTMWKRLTTPQDPSEGVIAGLREWLTATDSVAGDLELVVHGTTLVANALIERRGARTGVIATVGHRDILEIGRELRYDIYDLRIQNPALLVERSLRVEVDERLNALGAELIELSEGDVRAAADLFRRAEIESVAVSLLHSYVNSEHEDAVAKTLATVLPEVRVSLSSRVAPEIREFERTSTTVANAYVQPLMAAYLERMRSALAAISPRAAFYIMFSNGGLAPASLAAELPVQLVESGAAAGVQAACRYAGSWFERVLAFDMGGTTAKLSIVEHGAPSLTYQTEVARRARFKRGSGFPLLVPTVDLIEIGAGGGSIATVDQLGLLKVGPQSAGSEPGPACYGKGGLSATVTDANLLLGYLDEGSFLGVGMRLDRIAAESAIEGLGKALGLGATRCAQGIHDIVNESMANAARSHVAERAGDPRTYALIAFGGSGPTHAYGVARRLGVTTVIYPPAAGVASALGCLVAPPSVDLSRSMVSRLDRIDWVRLKALVSGMEERAVEVLAGAGVRADQVDVSLTADMRYLGQGFEIPVPLDPSAVNNFDEGELLRSFSEAYAARYGRVLKGKPIEATTWRLNARGPRAAIDLAALSRPADGAAPSAAERRVFFADAGGYVSCPVLARSTCEIGASLRGPAVIEDLGSAALIGPDVEVEVDEGGNLVAHMPPVG